MIRLVLYTENYFPGGLERFIFDLLNSHIFDIHIVVNSENNRIIEFAKKNGFSHTIVKLTSYKYTKLPSNKLLQAFFKVFNFMAYYCAMISNYFKIKTILKPYKHYENILIVNGGYPAALSSFSASTAAKNIGFTKVGMSILSSPSPYYTNKIFKFFQSKVDYITDKKIDFYLPNSNKIKLDLIENVKINVEKIKVVYTGVNIPKNRDKIQTLQYNNIQITKKNDDLWIVMVGLLGSTKRQDLLLNSMVKLNKNIHLLLAGDGPNRKILENKTHELGIADRVVFTGWIGNTEKIYQFADILVFLSNQEGLPYVISEAMSYKVPIIASSVGGIPEQIKHKLGGLLLANNSIENIVENIKYLGNDKELQIKFTDYSFKRLTGYFSVKAMNNNILDIYKGNI